MDYKFPTRPSANRMLLRRPTRVRIAQQNAARIPDKRQYFPNLDFKNEYFNRIKGKHRTDLIDKGKHVLPTKRNVSAYCITRASGTPLSDFRLPNINTSAHVTKNNFYAFPKRRLSSAWVETVDEPESGEYTDDSTCMCIVGHSRNNLRTKKTEVNTREKSLIATEESISSSCECDSDAERNPDSSIEELVPPGITHVTIRKNYVVSNLVNHDSDEVTTMSQQTPLMVGTRDEAIPSAMTCQIPTVYFPNLDNLPTVASTRPSTTGTAQFMPTRLPVHTTMLQWTPIESVKDTRSPPVYSNVTTAGINVNATNTHNVIQPRPNTIFGTFHARNNYAKNIERDWLAKRKEEIKTERREQTRQKIINKWLANRLQHSTGDIDTAFYSSDESDNDIDTPLDVNVLDEEQENNLTRWDSLEVMYSDYNMSDEYDDVDISLVLRAGKLVEKQVSNKVRQKQLRKKRRFNDLAALQTNDISDDEDQDEEIRKLADLNDVDIRAMRLRLKKKMAEDDITDLTMTREEMRKIIAGLQQQMKTKTKKKKRKTTIQWANRVETVTPMTLKDRFMRDYQDWFGETTTKSRQGELFPSSLPDMERYGLEYDQSINQILDGRMCPNPTPVNGGYAQILREIEDGEDDLLNKLCREDARALFLRMNRDALGKTRSRVLSRLLSNARRSSLDPCMEGEADDQDVQESLNSDTIGFWAEELANIRANAHRRLSLPLAPKPDEIVITVKTPMQRRMSLGSANSLRKRRNSVYSATSTKNQHPDFEEIHIDTRDMRRTRSARNLGIDEEEINLFDLTAGLEFPAKDVKIQICMRKRLRQRHRREARRLKALQQAQEDRTAAERTSPDSGNETDGEDESDEEEKVHMFRKTSFLVNSAIRYSGSSRADYSDFELDAMIASMTDLFKDMKDCRYLRWSPRDWAILQRFMELELRDLI